MHHAARSEPPRQLGRLLTSVHLSGLVCLSEDRHRVHGADLAHSVEVCAQGDYQVATKTGERRVRARG